MLAPAAFEEQSAVIGSVWYSGVLRKKHRDTSRGGVGERVREEAEDERKHTEFN